MKNNTKTLKITSIVIVIASMIAGIVYSYGVLNDNVKDNAMAIVKQEEECETCMNMNIRQDKDVIEIKGDLTHLKEDVREIKEDVKTILIEIRK